MGRVGGVDEGVFGCDPHFNRSDFHDFYNIKLFWVGDFGAKI